MNLRSSVSILVFTIAAGLGAGGCEQERKPSDGTQKKKGGDAGAPQAANVDPNIAKAVKEAAQGQGTGSLGNPRGGPPESGIFAPGQADRELARGAAPKITVGSTGGGDKVALSPVLVAAGGKREGQARVGIRMGPRQAMPTVELAFTLEAPKKDDAAGPLSILGRFSAARLSSNQPGQLPPGLDAQVQKLKGSKVQYALYDGGGTANHALDTVQGADASFVRELATVTETLPMVHGPFPKEPIGAGAFWMVTSREPFMGFDTVTYRMMRVERLDATSAALSVKTKRYVAGGNLDFPGVPASTLQRFEGQGEGQISVTLADGTTQADNREVVLTALASPQDPTRQMTLQLEISVGLVFPGRK